MLTYEEASSLFEYEESTGLLYWRGLPERYPNGRLRAKRYRTQKVSGSFNKYRNAINIQYEGINYKAHRLIWLIVFKEYPFKSIDHINGDGSDNRLSNLRLAESYENSQNICLRSDNKQGMQGVSFDKRRGTWSAELSCNKIRFRKSGFKTAEDAYEAYLALKKEHHTFHPLPPRVLKNKRLATRPERYKQQYIRMAMR